MKAGGCALRPLGDATCNDGGPGATGGATTARAPAPVSSMTGRELRAQLEMQQARNRSSAMGESATPTGAGDATVGTHATIDKPAKSADELHELVAIVAAEWTGDERAEAMAAALADPEAALVCFRALVAEREGAPARRGWRALTSCFGEAKWVCAPAEMRPCVDCANFTPSGRCLAAWRGESLGTGIATSRTWTPSTPDRPQRCGAYAPGSNDSDKRTGRERWPYQFTT